MAGPVYAQVVAGVVTGVFAEPQPDNPAVVALDPADPLLVAWNAQQSRLAANAPILAQIHALEAAQARCIREGLLSYVPAPGDPSPHDRLLALDQQIAALRAQLAG